MCGPFQILQAGLDSGPDVLTGHSLDGRFFAHISRLLRNCPRLFASFYPTVIHEKRGRSAPAPASGVGRARPRGVLRLDADPVAALDHGLHETAVRQG